MEDGGATHMPKSKETAKSMVNDAAHPANGTKALVGSAPPSWHAVGLVVCLLAILLRAIPSLDSIDEIASVETFTRIRFPDFLSVTSVIRLRLFFGCVMLGDSLFAVLYGKWDQDFDYYSNSRLTVSPNIPFRGMLMKDGTFRSGWLTLSSFTMWCWTLEGITFCMAACVPRWHAAGHSISPWFLRTTIICWEISAPFSFLVSAIVKYVLWPSALELGSGNVNVLKHPCALLEHNLNVLAALLEAGVMGGLPCRFQDYALAPLFGLIYVLYSWWMSHSWCDQRITCGPQFMYPFLDTTLGWLSTACLVALLCILLLTMTIFAAADHFWAAKFLGDSFLIHLLVVFVLASAFCRFRD